MEDLLREAEQIATGKLYDPIVVVTKRLILIGPDNIGHCFVVLETFLTLGKMSALISEKKLILKS